ncbi:helix-turn-helix domain-containing protein [Agromyces bracchium]|uniref:Helix-turn-helix domain-containing protein n=1 Tax=Agromyces bracchium TaxID=88376 RepID=A0A6I3MD47_9MICO|nr:helix-turn-helix transcriptional regulator [Agromyces bracchium]MTH69927.1 helix-turn-helix domain-containing protein [Agromyces bracchium]
MGETIEFPGERTDTRRPRRARPLWRDVLGDVLRDERLEQERILTEVARTAGVSPQYLSEVERGRKEASSEVLGAVADALGLELVDVVGRVAGRLALREVNGVPGGGMAGMQRSAVGPVTAPWSGAPAPTNAYLLAA